MMRTRLLLTLAAMLLQSAASRADLTPGDILSLDIDLTSPFGGAGVIRVDPATGAQAFVSQGGFIAPLDVAIEPFGSLVVTEGACLLPCQVPLPGVVRVDPSTGDQAPLSMGGNFIAFFSPTSIAVDSDGHIFVVSADPYAGTTLVRVNPYSGAQAVIASGGGLYDFSMIAIDRENRILTTGLAGDAAAVLRVDPGTGAQTVVASGGFLAGGGGIAIDRSGAILAEGYDGSPGYVPSIVRVDPASGAQELVSVGGNLCSGFDIAVESSGTLLVSRSPFVSGCDPMIVRVDPTTGAQTPLSQAGLFDGGGPLGLAVVLTDCSDGVDNDADGWIDFLGDFGCLSPDDVSEEFSCSDGLDNDGDGDTDFPADAGCKTPAYAFEDPQCDDGVDNDGDGSVDFPADPQCQAAWDNGEKGGCGLLGIELVILAPALRHRALRRRSLREGEAKCV